MSQFFKVNSLKFSPMFPDIEIREIPLRGGIELEARTNVRIRAKNGKYCLALVVRTLWVDYAPESGQIDINKIYRDRAMQKLICGINLEAVLAETFMKIDAPEELLSSAGAPMHPEDEIQCSKEEWLKEKYKLRF